MLSAFRILARLKFLRGTALDPFARTAERKWERQLLADYEGVLNTIEANLSTSNRDIAIALAAYPRKIRGFRPRETGAGAPGALGTRPTAEAFLEPAREPLAEAAE